ncbi:acetyl-CoA carboxylase biotin carboxylase subunit [Falsiphaeobacter marinintestinus]|uniref:acetyl-CoA carboxylase biotin carboxylase subunit n=1 Tax=Falsiphaeobacter marinintestinus TaxID=1492905 RepID=UPI0011B3D85B|nr:acetyl-CoA carboxylase biotin carboxylase subunit [Phaeobacter marinintestinus]
MTPLDTLLVANRGEIAVRIMRTAKAMGLRTVAVYSEADAAALHVSLADQAVCIGGASATESYLRIDRIIEAAQATGAQAVHPGYGFLAENAAFADACDKAGLIFVGPSAQVIASMGDKAGAKALMQAAGVPCVPGYQGEDQSPTRLRDEARQIGFPVMIKATSGGGGRGMRLVEREEMFDELLRSARSEALSAFGDDTVLLEKAIVNPRHVEIQVMADSQGNAIHCGERDCSVQRRHQKVIEEAPSPAVNEALRARMGEASLNAVRTIGYEGAGTFEYLLDREGAFYFMEMNTRLQVEHPVTEAITGLDLVELQLRVAAGEVLALSQSDVRFHGHAIEVRLCAEDPAAGFMPQSGVMGRWRPSPALRTDSGLFDGAEIPVHYDSMVAKLIAHGDTREDARRALRGGLSDTVALGVTTNQSFLSACLDHPDFVAGTATTGFIETHKCDLLPDNATQDAHMAMITAALLRAGPTTRLSHGFPTPLRLERGGVVHTPTVAALPEGRCRVTMNERTLDMTVSSVDGIQARFSIDGTAQTAQILRIDGQIAVHTQDGPFTFTDLTFEPVVTSGPAGGDGKVRASMNGTVVSVGVSVGDTVAPGQTVLVLEAMKMEHTHTALVDGTVTAVHVAPGSQVTAHFVVVEIDPG